MYIFNCQPRYVTVLNSLFKLVMKYLGLKKCYFFKHNCPCCKIFERIIFDRIQNYLIVFEILSDLQYGFRHGKSTVDTIATLIEEIRSNLHNNSEKTKCTFLDLKKAFDTVDHNILLQKCYRYGLRGPIYKILKS